MAAYSIGKQKKLVSTIQEDQLPGVGAYNVQQYVKHSRIKTTPNVVFGMSDRNVFEVKKLPGPSDYQTQKSTQFVFNCQMQLLTSKRFSMGKESKQSKILKKAYDLPGPGQYNSFYYSNKNPPVFTIPKSMNKQINNKIGPSPFDYHPRALNKTCGSLFPKEKKLSSYQKQVPGPAEYQYERYNRSTQKPKFSFTRTRKFFTQQRQQRVKTDIPGPGNYEVKVVNQKVAGGALAKSKCTSNNKDIPGPGSYELQKVSKRSPIATIGNSKRNSPRCDSTPGPSEYNTYNLIKLKKNSESIKFGKEVRHFESKNQIPGPGLYNIDYESKHSPPAIMTSRYVAEKKQKSPGPQSYEPNYASVMRNSQKSIIGTQKKFEKDVKAFIPGPGFYDGQKKAPQKSYSFKKEKKRQVKANHIGPGSYNIKSLFGINFSKDQNDYKKSQQL